VAGRVYDRRRTRRKALTFGACAAFALAWTGVATAHEVEPSLWSRLQRIESAFRSGDAHALGALLPGEAKVRVDLRGLTDGPRSYGPGQLEVVFRQIFAAQDTADLAFRPEEVKVAAAGTAFARARWTRATAPGAAPAVLFVTFTLRAQDGDWRIHEILCSR
jgi:hypothetical protein